MQRLATLSGDIEYYLRQRPDLELSRATLHQVPQTTAPSWWLFRKTRGWQLSHSSIRYGLYICLHMQMSSVMLSQFTASPCAPWSEYGDGLIIWYKVRGVWGKDVHMQGANSGVWRALDSWAETGERWTVQGTKGTSKSVQRGHVFWI